MPLTSWIWVNVNRQPKMKNSLSLFAVVSVSRSLMQNVYGLSIWLALSVLSVSIRCSGGKPQMEGAEDYTESDLISKEKGLRPLFLRQHFLQMQQQPIDRSVT